LVGGDDRRAISAESRTKKADPWTTTTWRYLAKEVQILPVVGGG
jgi:hypothetical protein